MGRLAVVVLLVVGGLARAGGGEGVAFLLGNQSSSGTFGDARGEDPIVATHETLEALSAVGLSSSSEAALARSALESLPLSVDSELISRRALSRSSAQSFTFDLTLAGHAAGFAAADSLDLAFALRAAVDTTTVANRTQLAALLIARTRSTGCHGWADEPDSAELTAQALIALRTVSFAPNASIATAGAAQCLLGLQQADGSWGDAASTSLAVIALSGTASDSSLAISRARSWLLAIQASDGSWGGSVRATALAVRALASSAPDLRIPADELGRPAIALSNVDPLRGETVTASLTVQNASSSPSPAVLIRALGATPSGEVVLAETFAGPLGAGQSVPVALALSTSTLTGQVAIRVVLDPNGVIAELDETNNEARATLQVRSGGDLLVSTGSIRFTAAGPSVSIAVDVRNLGEPLPAATSVNVYRGNPQSGGVLIGTAALSAGLGANQLATVNVSWTPPPFVEVAGDFIRVIPI